MKAGAKGTRVRGVLFSLGELPRGPAVVSHAKKTLSSSARLSLKFVVSDPSLRVTFSISWLHVIATDFNCVLVGYTNI